ncbi:hypothetical protein DT019_03200 [Streptomyces sp. SDr-06]|uniref:hypothetical protein n=1 Tax=Streptomyces sp. SDr-06 TaxID=2267702 RepID=UPI000DE8393D|nr:hypothetical protein [Streptomyces sp. SDr-06]RCH70511.1 hypothetical protein DT019_03200 [Streptomyces sp. SDr-06]
MSEPVEARCARCGQRRVVFPAPEEWGAAQSPLCTRDWQLYAEARANKTYVDFHDAFDNASDEELEEALRGPQ